MSTKIIWKYNNLKYYSTQSLFFFSSISSIRSLHGIHCYNAMFRHNAMFRQIQIRKVAM